MKAKAGEIVRIHFKNGTTYVDNFKSVTQDSILTFSRSFALDEIQNVEKRENDDVKTAGAIAGGYIALTVIGAIVFLAVLLSAVDTVLGGGG